MKKNYLFVSILIFNLLFAQITVQDIISKADSLYQKFKYNEALELYSEILKSDSLNYEANWKAARTFIDIGETLEKGKQRSELFIKGEKYARKATQVDSLGSKGHLYLSIALGRTALDASAKKRIQLSKEIKKEVDLAIKYNPSDDIAFHVLGRWNRKVANLNWIERGFANLFLGGVPKEASNENAVKCFLKSIELNPYHINHHLELAMTYEKMKQKDKAREEYQKCLDLPVKDIDDEKHKELAKSRLEKLK